MEQFPILDGERTVGELSVEREGLYTRFSVSCSLPEEGIFCAWAVGERGKLRIGVLEPCCGRGQIIRRFSDSVTAPVGKLCRGELRSVEEMADEESWQPMRKPEDWFRTAWLCGQLQRFSGVQIAREKGCCRVAIPYEGKTPFPLTQLFCLARIAHIGGISCAVYAFDGKERPIFP